ncbi:MAG: DUF1643 domain-containing protein [Lutibacter sp.]|jgi:hypothetical protein|nr:DUF1643 domain-containing protein [Lutibacter sp.]
MDKASINKKTTWLYHSNPENTNRFVLGQKGKKIIACIGVNPSTASPEKPDNTIRSVKRIADYNGFDGWAMYNIYPQRATDPAALDQAVNKADAAVNCQMIYDSIKALNIETVWLAWGNLIDSRAYLKNCLIGIYEILKEENLHWKIIGKPTKRGHPSHPLYKKRENPLIDFDMEAYLKKRL